MHNTIFTVGHSTHEIGKFIGLLKMHDITAICDVRSSPYSRFNPQYNREVLNRSLQDAGIKYVFLGEELGARSKDPSCYRNGRVQYNLLAKTELFQNGIKRIRHGLEKGYKMALVCAEKDPLDCHRTVLVARNLDREGFSIFHILSDGSLETQKEATARLVRQFNLNQHDMFSEIKDEEAEAYQQQEKKIAYAEDDGNAQAERTVTQ